MTITQADYAEAEQQHQAATEQLQTQMAKLAGLENEAYTRRKLLDELQKSVDRKRHQCFELQNTVNDLATRCLEIQVQLERMETVEL